jgi:hypothetical protein
MRHQKILCCAIIAAATGFSEAPSQTDAVHLLLERTRSTQFISRPPDTTEVWIGENAVVVGTGTESILFRYDLNRLFFLRPSRRVFYESGLDSREQEEQGADTSIHTKGWEYTPLYDWTVEDMKEEKTLEGYACHHYVARGEADYSERTLDFWVTRESPIRLDRYNDRRFYSHIPGDPRSEELLKAFPDLYTSVIVSSQEKLVPAIAPEGTIGRRIILIERKQGPPGVFDVPGTFKRLETYDEYLDAR